MPRMTKTELIEIIEKGFAKTGLTIDRRARNVIAHLSQGLPFYTHYLGLYAGLAALDRGKLNVEVQDVMDSTQQIISKAYSIRSAYHKATSSPQRSNLYAEVLLACALAYTDELGYFSAKDVSQPMSQIMRKKYDIENFKKHLKEFCRESRGKVLQSIGMPRRIRYRFVDPLMQPFVILDGLAKGRINLRTITEQSNPTAHYVEEPVMNGDVATYDATF